MYCIDYYEKINGKTYIVKRIKTCSVVCMYEYVLQGLNYGHLVRIRKMEIQKQFVRGNRNIEIEKVKGEEKC